MVFIEHCYDQHSPYFPDGLLKQCTQKIYEKQYIRDLGDVCHQGSRVANMCSSFFVLLNYNYNQTSIIIGYLLISFKPISNSPFHNRQRPASELNLKSLTISIFFLSFSPYSSYYYSKYKLKYPVLSLLQQSSLSFLLVIPSKQQPHPNQ